MQNGAEERVSINKRRGMRAIEQTEESQSYLIMGAVRERSGVAGVVGAPGRQSKRSRAARSTSSAGERTRALVTPADQLVINH